MWKKLTSVCWFIFIASCIDGKTKLEGRPMRWVSKESALEYLTKNMSDMNNFKLDVLNPMLVQRISDTPEIAQVRKHIVKRMRSLGWQIEENSFEDDTPFGRKTFVNIIATQNPGRARRTVVACHYDSKDLMTKDKLTFIGATDSAVPCAVMLETAAQLQCLLTKGPRENSAASDLTLQFIFFDGEEAFESWTSTDSIYGARHLAKKWEDADKLKSIREFILLDLIGHSSTQFVSHFDKTSSLFEQLMKIEKYLRSHDLLSSGHKKPLFSNQSIMGGGIEDDHVPFLRRGVQVLHLISTPFPPVWHRPQDDGDHLDFDLIDNFSRIFRVFLSNLLHLSPEKLACRKK